MEVKGSTNIVGLIGNPVGHSFSPPMHNAAFEKLGMNYIYVAFDVLPKDLEIAIKGAKALSIIGLNVTIPHKIDAMNHLNEVDEIAKLIGAVNTIDLRNLKGYNTDGIGSVKAIKEVTPIKDKKVVIAGAGGASRAISFYIANEKPEKISILNRNVKKAERLEKDILNSKIINNTETDSINEINKYLNDADILIDTTPIGMYPNINDTPIANSTMFHEDLVVNDIVYNPNETTLIKETIKAGATPVYGIKMLLYQGAESFRIWTGQEPPIDAMEDALKKYLND